MAKTRKATGIIINSQGHYECETYAGEEQGPQWGVDDVQDLVTDEDAEEGEEQQHDQAHKQHAPTGSEVILALWWRRKGKWLENMSWPTTLNAAIRHTDILFGY